MEELDRILRTVVASRKTEADARAALNTATQAEQEAIRVRREAEAALTGFIEGRAKSFKQ